MYPPSEVRRPGRIDTPAVAAAKCLAMSASIGICSDRLQVAPLRQSVDEPIARLLVGKSSGYAPGAPIIAPGRGVETSPIDESFGSLSFRKGAFNPFHESGHQGICSRPLEQYHRHERKSNHDRPMSLHACLIIASAAGMRKGRFRRLPYPGRVHWPVGCPPTGGLGAFGIHLRQNILRPIYETGRSAIHIHEEVIAAVVKVPSSKDSRTTVGVRINRPPATVTTAGTRHLRSARRAAVSCTLIRTKKLRRPI